MKTNASQSFIRYNTETKIFFKSSHFGDKMVKLRESVMSYFNSSAFTDIDKK